MDPVQWSNVKRDIVAENRRQEAIKQRLLYPQQQKSSSRSRSLKKRQAARQQRSQSPGRSGSRSKHSIKQGSHASQLIDSNQA